MVELWTTKDINFFLNGPCVIKSRTIVLREYAYLYHTLFGYNTGVLEYYVVLVLRVRKKKCDIRNQRRAEANLKNNR